MNIAGALYGVKRYWDRVYACILHAVNADGMINRYRKSVKTRLK